MLRALFALALLASACGAPAVGGVATLEPGTGGASGSSPSPSANVDRNEAMLAFAQCMRENGVPEFPDPVDGRLTIRSGPGEGMDPNSPTFQAAEAACESLRPAPPAGAEGSDEESFARALEFSQCMRDNGVPDFPDPERGPGGRGMLQRAPGSVDPQSATFQAAQEACEELRPGADDEVQRSAP